MKQRLGPTHKEITSLTVLVKAGLHDQTTPSDGSTIDATADLNPLFVEALMGLPQGWTGYMPLETESYLRWLQQHSLPSLNVPA